jgi:hypothetical protein
MCDLLRPFSLTDRRNRVYSSSYARPIFLMMAAHDQRSEARHRSKGIVTLLAEGAGPLQCRIYDVSPSGLGLGIETQINLAPGTAVVIEGLEFTASGVVRFCYHNGQICRLGIELQSP